MATTDTVHFVHLMVFSVSYIGTIGNQAAQCFIWFRGVDFYALYLAICFKTRKTRVWIQILVQIEI